MGRIHGTAALCGLGLAASLLSVGLSGPPAQAADAVLPVSSPLPTARFQSDLAICPGVTGVGGTATVAAVPAAPAPPSGPDALALAQPQAGDTANWYFDYGGDLFDLTSGSGLDVYDPAGGALLYWQVAFLYENASYTLVLTRPVNATTGWKHLEVYDLDAVWAGYQETELGDFVAAGTGTLIDFDDDLNDYPVEAGRIGIMRPGTANSCGYPDSPAGTTYVDNVVLTDRGPELAYDFESTAAGHQDIAITSLPPDTRILDPNFDLCMGTTSGATAGSVTVEPVTDPLLGGEAARFHTSATNEGAGLLTDLGLFDSLDDLAQLKVNLRDPDGASVVELGLGFADESHTVYDFVLRFLPPASPGWQTLDLLALDYAWLNFQRQPIAGSPGTIAEFVEARTTPGDLTLAVGEMKVARAPCIRPDSPAVGDVWVDGLTAQRAGDYDITWDLESSAPPPPTPLPVLTAAASPTKTVAGKATKLSGTIKDHGTTAMAGVTLTLQAKPYGSAGWRPAGSATTDAAGRVVRSVVPARQTAYRWVVTSDPSRTSPPVTVRVTPVLTVKPVKVKRGRTLVVTGTTKPALVGAVVTIKANGKKLGTVKVGANGTFKFTKKVGRAGKYKIVASVAAGGGFLGAVSAPRKVRVK